MQTGFKIFDADAHVVEPKDMWDRFLDSRFKDRDDGMGAPGAGDSIVIRAQTRYGFTCGRDGMGFLIIRTGESSTSL